MSRDLRAANGVCRRDMCSVYHVIDRWQRTVVTWGQAVLTKMFEDALGNICFLSFTGRGHGVEPYAYPDYNCVGLPHIQTFLFPQNRPTYHRERISRHLSVGLVYLGVIAYRYRIEEIQNACKLFDNGRKISLATQHKELRVTTVTKES